MGGMRTHETTIADCESVAHHYTCQPFAFDEAFDLGLEIAAVVGGPLGDAFKALLIGGELEDGALDENVLSKAAAGLGDVPARLIARGGSALIARILATTIRVGTDDKGPIKQPMADANNRTAAYSGGNLMEAINAVKWVLQVNYGPFLTGLWDALTPHLSELAQPSTQAGTKETPPSATQPEQQKPSETVYLSSSA